MDQIELDHVTQVIGYHPSYLEQFLKIQTFIIYGDGPLPFDYRHYLAIMVSSTYIYLFFVSISLPIFASSFVSSFSS